MHENAALPPQVDDVSPPATLPRQLGRLIKNNPMPLVMVLIAVFFSLAAPRFFSVNNFLTIANNAAVGGILALGMTFVLILGGVDLSVGSTVTLTTVVVALLLTKEPLPVDPWLALPLGLLTGCLVGLANGLLIVKAKVPPIIVTLGTLYIVQSIASFATQGAIISLSGVEVLRFLGQGFIGPIQVPVVLLFILTLVCAILLNRTVFGATVRAIGGNQNATTLMGINVALYQVLVYVFCGLLASVGGLIVAGRLSMGSAQAGLSLELTAIAASVLGGTSLSGGEGSIAGTLFGALMLSMIFNGLILLRIPFFYQLVTTGLILVFAISLNDFVRKHF